MRMYLDGWRYLPRNPPPREKAAGEMNVISHIVNPEEVRSTSGDLHKLASLSFKDN
jgi:hypothetical protein